MTSPEPFRAAIYFAPDSQQETQRAWWQAGCRWLGRDAATDQACTQVVVPGVGPGVLTRLTADPRRYGWHGTLKAPFQLAEGVTLSGLDDAVRALAEDLSAFELPPLAVSDMGHFLALRPAHPSGALQTLAAACVTELHPLAQPLSAEDLARRLRAPLSPRQTGLLTHWGYPWVLDEFRFHCTLTGDLQQAPTENRQAIEEAAREHFSDLPAPRANSLAIFVEPTAGAPFRLHRHWPLRGTSPA